MIRLPNAEFVCESCGMAVEDGDTCPQCDAYATLAALNDKAMIALEAVCPT